MAAIEPACDPERAAVDGPKQAPRRPKVVLAKSVLALPKGLVDPGEKPLETALREVYEETGVSADPVRSWVTASTYIHAFGEMERGCSRSSVFT